MKQILERLHPLSDLDGFNEYVNSYDKDDKDEVYKKYNKQITNIYEGWRYHDNKHGVSLPEYVELQYEAQKNIKDHINRFAAKRYGKIMNIKY